MGFFIIPLFFWIFPEASPIPLDSSDPSTHGEHQLGLLSPDLEGH